ncbi:MAG: threonine/serine exporter family protein [Tannerellaceae bacterium]|nr:threonine/serine exporter family protein [Tannerellaceae bacterium]
MITAIIHDAFFAAIAGMGFGAISDPPMRAFPYIAVLAAFGHALRFILMNVFGFDIATASLFGAVIIGFGSLWLGGKAFCPATVLYIPALLPMVPGKIAYSAVFSLIMFLQTMENPELNRHYMDLFLSNGLLSLTVIFFLTVGATIPVFIFPAKAYSLTRRKS